jgi:acyl-CoA dehydrogenase
MTYGQTEEQRLIQSAVAETFEDLSETYWRECDARGEFPQEFWDRLADGGWLGMHISEEYGGFEGGMESEVAFVQSVAETGAGFGAAFVYIIHSLVGLAIARSGTPEQKDHYLPKMADGDISVAFALTEPETGFDTLSMNTSAERDTTSTGAVEDGDEWVIEGEKTYITGAERADLILLIARTTPLEEVEKRSHGLTMFLVEPGRESVDLDVTPLDKLGLNYLDTSHVYINPSRVPADAVLGEVGHAWPDVIDLLNPERMIVSAGCLGGGNYVLEMAADYANEREVFDRPIGQNQGIQFPLAEAKIHLEAAETLNNKAAWLYDAGEHCGLEANAANFLACEWGTKAANRAIQTHGGSGYMRDTEVERFWREMRLQEMAPVSQEMILNYVGEHVLDLPKSY